MTPLRLLLLLTLCAPSLGCMGLLGEEIQAPPTARGPHAVGVTTIEVAGARDRKLPVEVWYPASPDARRAPVVYRVKSAGLIVARLRSVVGAQRNVPVLADRGPRPVVLVSHGSGSTRFANTSLAEVLASNGYIVAAPDHLGHTMQDHVFGMDDVDRAQSAFDRPVDLSRILDELAARSAKPGSLFTGRVAADRAAVAGHSFGGFTALSMVGARFDGERQARECRLDGSDQRCRAVPIFGEKSYRYRDPRIKAAMLLTPGWFEFHRADGIAEVDTPTLLVATMRDVSDPFEAEQKPVFDALKGPRYMLPLDEAGHLTATNVCAMVDSIGALARASGGDDVKDGCGEGFMSSAEALDRVASAAIPFLDLHVGGELEAEAVLAAALAPRPSSGTQTAAKSGPARSGAIPATRSGG